MSPALRVAGEKSHCLHRKSLFGLELTRPEWFRTQFVAKFVCEKCSARFKPCFRTWPDSRNLEFGRCGHCLNVFVHEHSAVDPLNYTQRNKASFEALICLTVTSLYVTSHRDLHDAKFGLDLFYNSQ